MDFLDDLMMESSDLDLIDKDILSLNVTLPESLCIIPIRYRPVFPGIVTPLIISSGKFADAIENVLKESRTIGLVLIKDDEKEEIVSKDIYSIGTAARILKKINLPDGSINVLINSVKRFKIKKVTSEDPYIVANVRYISDILENKKSMKMKALQREVLSQLKLLSDNNPFFTEEMKLTMLNVDEPGKIADFVTSILNVEKKQYQDILITLNVKARLEKVLKLLYKEQQVMAIQKKIQTGINDKIDKQQRDFYLREQLKAIKTELGMDEDDRTKDINEIRKRAEALGLKGEAKEKVEEEINRISIMEQATAEFTVTKNYLETVLSLPWNVNTKDTIDLDRAEKILNKDHYGLEDVKKRIVEFLAVKKLKADSKGSIVCLVGPPGVGKTSLGKSIAAALNRKFFKISLGGMRDEAEIKGHRRTYIGAMPGKIIQGIRLSKAANPVFMLDEIDKIGQSFQGDPGAALLEVLDPEQNSEFRDHYIDLPFDLSKVLFIATANTTDSIPPVLLDRMEIIRLSGYIPTEKQEIARRYLLPKQLKHHGLKNGDVLIDKKGFLYIIEGWAREAGVRNLERGIEKICRKTATIAARKKRIPKTLLSNEKIREYLGPEVYNDEELQKTAHPGVATGLAWTSHGGATLIIESIGIHNRKGGELKLTGQLGAVMTESADIAFSYVRHLLKDDETVKEFFNSNTVHLHVPAGAIPKDGPSAGITMASSIYSLATGKTIKNGLAMTGELTLTGRVYPVGGIKEKIIAARRAHIKEIIIPGENRRDLEEIPEKVKKGIRFHEVGRIEEVMTIAFSGKKSRKK
jgi:ATP-dependent Lon protease